MSISIVHGTPHLTWVGIEPATTIYVGGLVAKDQTAGGEGVIVLPDAAGVANVTNHDIPLLCIGTNLKTPVYDSASLTEIITSPAAADAHDGSAAEYIGTNNKAMGDPIPMVRVALIDPTTILRAPLYNAAVGVAPTLLTVSTGDTDGLGCTTNASQCTSIAENRTTFYFRTGANAGVRRLTDSASSTVHTWDVATRNDVAVGDTAVMVPVTDFGPATVMFDATTAAWIDASDDAVTAGTNRWSVFVTHIDLSVAGQEYVEFRFDPSHFGTYTTTA